MKDKANKWFKLDNSGKIFPNVYSKRESHTFRIQVSLTETIDPKLLQVAINEILNRFPMFKEVYFGIILITMINHLSSLR